MQDEGEDDFLLIFLEYDNIFVPLRKICVFLTKIIWNLDYNEEDSPRRIPNDGREEIDIEPTDWDCI